MEQVIERLAAIAFADLSDYMRWGPTGLDLVDSSELTDGKRAAVESLRVTKAGFVLKLRDSIRALELLGKYLGAFEEKVQLSVGLAETFDEVRRLAEQRARGAEGGSG